MKPFITNITSYLKKLYPTEVIIGTIIIGIINYIFYPDDPGFFYKTYNPYFIIILFFSCFYGKLSGVFTLFVSVFCIAINFIIINYGSDLLQLQIDTFFSEKKYNPLIQFLFMGFIFSIIIGEIRDSLGISIRKYKKENRDIISKNNKLESELKAITIVNEEYQDRILGQQNSLISLYSTMIALNSLDLNKIYPNILEAVVKFSGATRCSLWEYLRDERMLQLLAYHGWDAEPSERKIPDSNNITGWVARNNEVFSVKILQKHSNLQEIDNKQNIITVPINIGNHVWGIINVEEMPFVKYNLYSEQLLMMIADLSAPIINNAIRFDEISRKGEIDAITGLPALDEMFSTLKEEYARSVADNSKLSLVIFEMTNSEEFLEEYSKDQVRTVFRDIIQIIKTESKKDSYVFQYKEEFQFALILPNVDYDGAAMMCLSFIEKINTHEFNVSGNTVMPEIILGYSSMRANLKSEEDLMILAENLLEMQKI
jgi:GGDEF domain-containing protein